MKVTPAPETFHARTAVPVATLPPAHQALACRRRHTIYNII